MKWVFVDYMGRFNPVCEDVGKILKIKPNYPAAPYTYSHVLEIETDEGVFGCDTKFDIVRLGGFCLFEQNGEMRLPLKYVKLDRIKHGDTVTLNQNDVLMLGNETLTPITTDPRVLCIMHRAHNDLPAEPTEEQFKQFCERIPTKKEAVEYLKARGAQMECLPWSAITAKLEQERT
jgi:hypothetical protein